MKYDELLDLLKERRTIRAIRPDPLPEGMVDKLLVVEELELRLAIKRIVDDYKNADFFALEATREAWQGSPWAIETHGPWDSPLTPVDILVLGDTRRRVGLPMAARYSRQKGDSIFESSLPNAFLCLWLAAHTLGLAAQPVSGVKYPKVQGLVKDLLRPPDFIYIYDVFLVGYPAAGGAPSPKLTRPLAEMVHHDRAAAGEFLGDDELRAQIVELRAGNVARHVEADRIGGQL